jgi:hypothetical protein
VISRQDLLSDKSPDWLRVFQLTTEPDVSSSHIYMEAQIFTPDSKRLIVHRSATAHGGDKDDPEHQYLICDLENDGELIPITHELGATAPAVSPDGVYLYYFVDRTEVGGGTLTLKRVKLDGTERETITVVDSQLPGTNFRPSFIYSLSTISSDGKRIALPCFLRDGERVDLPYGLLVFDVETPSVWVPVFGNDWTNMHAQYCRSRDPEASHDIMVQHNHSHFFDRAGNRHFSTGGLANDIHVIRDDGTNLRVFPWGRDPEERQAGHECWVGRSTRGISGIRHNPSGEGRLIGAQKAVEDVGHLGMNTPGAKVWRNNLSRSFSSPNLIHFGVDIAGERLIVDEAPRPEKPTGYIYLADVPDDGERPLQSVTPLLDARSSWQKITHPHPFLSPDGTMGFFNSDVGGTLQAYMVCGWE